MRTLLTATVLCIATLLHGSQEPAAPTVAELLPRIQQALGVPDFPKEHPGVRVKGKLLQYGLEVESEFYLDGQGRFFVSTTGPFAETRTFDGTTAWITDWSRTTRPHELRDRDLSLTGTWLVSGYWAARPDLYELKLKPEDTTEKEWAIALARKESHFPLTVYVDKATFLPVRATGKLRDQEHVYQFGPRLTIQGLKLPQSWTHTASNLTTKAEYSPAEPGTPPSFTLARHRSRQASYNPAIAGKLEVKKAISGHLLVQPTLGGEKVGWFVLDSGAGHMCIEKTVAEKLQLETFGEIAVAGIGSTIKSRFCKSPSFELGPVTLKDATYVELDLKRIGQAMGVELAGIVGYPVWQGAIAEVDCHAPAVTLHDPAKFALPKGTTWRRLILESNHPVVEARYEGDRTGWFRLDTGAANFLAFHSPAVKRHGLTKERQTMRTMIGGVGGMVPAKAGRLEWFELGGHRFDKPAVIFAEADRGALADEYTDGNLGQQAVRPFRVVFNYGEGQIAFIPKAAEQKEAGNADGAP